MKCIRDRCRILIALVCLIACLSHTSETNATPVVWLEAEHLSGGTFDDIYMASGLSAGRGLHFSTESEGGLGRYTARYEVHIPESGRYVLWGRRHLYYYDEGSVPLINRLKRYVEFWWRIDGGQWQQTGAEVEPVGFGGSYPTSVGHLGYTRTGDAEMAGKTIGWYRDGTLELNAGMHVLEVRVRLKQETTTPLFQPRLNRYYGLLDAFVFADADYTPDGRVRPEDAYYGIRDTLLVPVEDVRMTIDAEAVGDTLPNLIGFGIYSLPEDSVGIARIQALRPAFWRICHLYNAAKVSRDASGQLVFDWTSLDQIVDQAIALGIEPMMCISYTPEFLSSMPPDTPRGPGAGDPGMYPPADYEIWEEVVYQTVYHFNVERGLNIRYWSVWNEPNNIFLNVWHIWEWTEGLPFGSLFRDIKKLFAYARIYEAASRGAVRADPSIRIGGPSVLCNGDVEDFTGDVGRWINFLAWWCDWYEIRLDFISLHLYAGPPDSQNPDDYADLIRRAREWAARSDGTMPEILFDEWNAWSMPGGHDTATEYHAVWTMDTIYAMMEAGVERSVYFAGADFLSIFEPDGTPRPVYNLMKMYARLAPQKLSVSDTKDVRLIASRSSDTLTALLWQFGSSHSDITLTLTSLPPYTTVRYRRFLMDETHSNFRAGPDHAGLEEVDYEELQTGSDGTLTLYLLLPRTGATLVEIEY